MKENNRTDVLLEGEFAGHKIFQWINFENPSERAAEIGRSQLARVCRAVGKTQPGASSELHEVPCAIKVRVRAGKMGYDNRNEVVRVGPLQSNPSDNPEAPF